VAIGFRRPIRPGGQHQTRLGCVLGAALGVLLVAVGTRVSGESPLTGRVTDHLAVQQQRTEIPAAYAPIDYGFFAQLLPRSGRSPIWPLWRRWSTTRSP